MSIGSRVYSSDIERMYKAIISGKMAFSSDADALVTVEPNRINLGELRPNENTTHSVIFSNPSTDTIHIREIVSSCDCTNLSIPDEALPPESEVETILTFAGDTVPGEFERTVHVYFEDFEYPAVINIFGNIIY